MIFKPYLWERERKEDRLRAKENVERDGGNYVDHGEDSSPNDDSDNPDRYDNSDRHIKKISEQNMRRDEEPRRHHHHHHHFAAETGITTPTSLPSL